MKKYEGYNLIEVEDIDAAMDWVEQLHAEDPKQAEEVEALRYIITTGLTYARVVADNMGGLPCFHKGQSAEERQKAMAAAAKMAKRPGKRK